MWESCVACENAASPVELDCIIESAGVSDERRAVFHAHLTQFNVCASSTLCEGYQTVSAASPCYDPYLLQDNRL